ncbi:hypothetical protein BKE38_01880 [Pseudoroseomonas deserti]|uniref:Uncharacterized protein n=1 Tax=Teichococcus deserti TaxID=1817963 RepID=A0A1V2H7P9_9PROT|nr:hypothetical protein BKE38_01880 [Pseudoroseomonas deserti]
MSMGWSTQALALSDGWVSEDGRTFRATQVTLSDDTLMPVALVPHAVLAICAVIRKQTDYGVDLERLSLRLC